MRLLEHSMGYSLYAAIRLIVCKSIEGIEASEGWYFLNYCIATIQGCLERRWKVISTSIE